MGIMRVVSPLLVSRPSTAMRLTVTAIAIAIILLASNFTIINAQQSLTSQPGEIENGTTTATVPTTFQSTTDSFGVQVPEGWVIQDLNNTGSALLEETRQGYGILAQLCPEEEQQQQGAAAATASPLTNASGGNTLSCEPSENDVIHIVRYPDLDTRLLANNVTFDDNMTTDNILSYHLQKLQEVGYRSIQLVNSTDMTLDLTNPQTNETIATVPAKLVEMTYSTNFAPNETRTGYFISTATNATLPNLGTTKGYAIFYEGNSTTAAATAEITTAAPSSILLPPLPPAVGQVIDSFELIAAAQAMAQEGAQTAETAEGGDDGANNDDDDGANNDDDDGANNDDDDGANNDDDDGETSDGGISSRGDRFAGDDYDGDDDDGANDYDGGDDDGETSDGGISSRGDRFAGDDYG